MKARSVKTFLATLLLASAFGLVSTRAEPIRETDTTLPAEGNVLVSVPGAFIQDGMDKAVSMVNEIRLEACQKGYPNPATGDPLTMADYMPIKWSGDLEWIAQTRAAEALINEEHTRPNGKSWYTITHNGVQTESEVLAWCGGGIEGAISLWYSEKDAWVKQNHTAVTGHYTAMISPSNLYMGMGCFRGRFGDTCSSAGEFSSMSSLPEYSQGISGDYIQIVEVQTASVNPPHIRRAATHVPVGSESKKESFAVGSESRYEAYQAVVYPDLFMSDSIPILPMGTITWSSSDAAVASVSADGLVKARKAGSCKINATLPDGSGSSFNVVVKKPKAGMTFQIGENGYKILKGNKEVTFLGSTAAIVKIPATVKLGKNKYKVTAIADYAFSGDTALLQITIGNNVTSIGQWAFGGCTGLTTVTLPARIRKIGYGAFLDCANLQNLVIRTKTLTGSTVGKKAFVNTHIETVIVPKGKKKQYKQILSRRGIKKARYK